MVLVTYELIQGGRMRPTFLLLFALLPAAANAQARNVAALAPETTMTAMMSASPAAKAAGAANIKAPSIITHQFIKAVVDADFAQPLVDPTDSSLAVTFGGPSNVTAPKLISVSGLHLDQAALQSAPGKSKVAVRVLVDRSGKPENVRIAQSAGPAIDESALAAVKSYRFAPATVNHVPIEAGVTVTVTIDKQ